MCNRVKEDNRDGTVKAIIFYRNVAYDTSTLPRESAGWIPDHSRFALEEAPSNRFGTQQSHQTASAASYVDVDSTQPLVVDIAVKQGNSSQR